MKQLISDNDYQQVFIDEDGNLEIVYKGSPDYLFMSNKEAYMAELDAMVKASRLYDPNAERSYK